MKRETAVKSAVNELFDRKNGLVLLLKTAVRKHAEKPGVYQGLICPACAEERGETVYARGHLACDGAAFYFICRRTATIS